MTDRRFEHRNDFSCSEMEDELDDANAGITEQAKLKLAALDRCECVEAECERLRAALQQIAETSRWYADNGQRDPHEVDHALCVEIVSVAEAALGGAVDE